MEVILKQKVDRLGEAFEIVNVKNGYAENFLIPKKLAVFATASAKSRIEYEKKLFAVREEKNLKNAEILSEKLKDVSVTIPVKVDDNEHLYGSVSSQMVVDSLKKEGYNINKKDVVIKETIKSLGVYPVEIAIRSGVSTEIKVWVVKEEVEAASAE